MGEYRTDVMKKIDSFNEVSERIWDLVDEGSALGNEEFRKFEELLECLEGRFAEEVLRNG